MPTSQEPAKDQHMAAPDTSMTAKICLVTGATAGIGEVTAREVARRGARVVIVGRSQQRCEATAESIRQQTGNPAVEFLVADLSSQAQVHRLAREFLDRHRRLDVLVNNAGALFAQRRDSVDGIEMTLALNHLSYFLLTSLLLDTLKASAPARIVNVSSRAHRRVKGLNFDDLQARALAHRFWGFGESTFAGLLFTLFAPMRHAGFIQYARTKFANLLFTYELARRLEGTGVTVNALHPGFVASRFMAGNGALGWFMRRWASLFGISPEEGAKTSIYLATSPEVEGITGKYFEKQTAIASSPASRDEAAARRLWQLSEELVGGSSPPC
jgi:NAD(P)-dependent dehydrogenase (short-subunit alcohol dehydrogenase family)